jgi:hypothetical protein
MKGDIMTTHRRDKSKKNHISEVTPETLKNKLTEVHSILLDNRGQILDHARAITQQIEEIELLQTAMDIYPPTANTESINNTYYYASDYSSELVKIGHQFNEWGTYLCAGGTILTSGSQCIVESNPKSASYLVQKIETIRNVREDRNLVYDQLMQINPYIADCFISAWESLEAPPKDTVRGPGFYMRETITGFLHHFAPNQSIESTEWYKPFDEKTKITRAYRIKYIFENCVPPVFRNEITLKNLKNLDKLYQKLNYTHNQNILEVDRIKIYLLETQDCMKSVISFLGK